MEEHCKDMYCRETYEIMEDLSDKNVLDLKSILRRKHGHWNAQADRNALLEEMEQRLILVCDFESKKCDFSTLVCYFTWMKRHDLGKRLNRLDINLKCMWAAVESQQQQPYRRCHGNALSGICVQADCSPGSVQEENSGCETSVKFIWTSVNGDEDMSNHQSSILPAVRETHPQNSLEVAEDNLSTARPQSQIFELFNAEEPCGAPEDVRASSGSHIQQESAAHGSTQSQVLCTNVSGKRRGLQMMMAAYNLP